MDPEEIQAHLRRRPFQPIRVHLTDGRSYDVRHPEKMQVEQSRISITLESPLQNFERSFHVHTAAVERIEPLDPS